MEVATASSLPETTLSPSVCMCVWNERRKEREREREREHLALALYSRLIYASFYRLFGIISLGALKVLKMFLSNLMVIASSLYTMSAYERYMRKPIHRDYDLPTN